MTNAYAIAYLRDIDFGEALVDYLQRIDATLAPHGGRFVVHGGGIDAVEGEWPGQIVIIEFPDHDAARAWYFSPGYQEIVRLRIEHTHSIAAIVDGVPADYAATDGLAAILADQAAAG